MSNWGYKGINDPPNGCAGFLNAVAGLIVAPIAFGMVGFAIGAFLLRSNGAYTIALLGVVVGLVLGLWNAVTMPERVRKAKRMRDIYRDMYDRL